MRIYFALTRLTENFKYIIIHKSSWGHQNEIRGKKNTKNNAMVQRRMTLRITGQKTNKNSLFTFERYYRTNSEYSSPPPYPTVSLSMIFSYLWLTVAQKY